MHGTRPRLRSQGRDYARSARNVQNDNQLMREKKGGRRRRRRAHRPPSQTPLNYVRSAIDLHLNAEVRSRTGLDAIARLLFGGAGGGGGVDGDGNDGGGSGNCSSAPPPSVVVPLTATTTTTVTVTTKTWATTSPRGGQRMGRRCTTGRCRPPSILAGTSWARLRPRRMRMRRIPPYRQGRER